MTPKHLYALALAFFFVTLPAAHCDKVTRQDVQQGLSFAQTACLLANSLLDSPALKAICQIPDALMPQAERVAAQHNAAVATARMEEREVAARRVSATNDCARDAGAGPALKDGGR